MRSRAIQPRLQASVAHKRLLHRKKIFNELTSHGLGTPLRVNVPERAPLPVRATEPTSVQHDLNPRAMSLKVKGFQPAQSWYQDFTKVTVE